MLLRIRSAIRRSFFFPSFLFFKNLAFLFFPKSSFSQEGEDLIARNWLPERNGSFLDIGSGMPIWGSNTYFFYRKGWRGCSVDALESNIKYSRIIRRFDESIHALVGTSDTVSFFWEFDSYEYSTASHLQAQKVMQSEEFVKGKISLVRKTETSVFDINRFLVPCNPSSPFFFSLDIEGLDYEILIAIDWVMFRPRVICVEDNEHICQRRESRIYKFLSTLDYVLVGVTPLSSIYVAEEYLKRKIE